MINDEINNVLAKYTLLDMSGFNESGDDVR